MENLNSGVLAIDCSSLKSLIDKGDVILIDVRETHEFEYENIPGSFLLPLSFLDKSVFPSIDKNRVVFMCAMGTRSIAAIKQLRMTNLKNIFYLEGGIGAWKKAGYSTQGGKFESLDWSI